MIKAHGLIPRLFCFIFGHHIVDVYNVCERIRPEGTTCYHHDIYYWLEKCPRCGALLKIEKDKL